MRLGLRMALVATVLAFGLRLVESFETPKADVVRIAGLGLASAALAVPARLKRLRPGPLDLAVTAWLLVEALATAFSRAPLISVFGEMEQHEGLFTSVGFAGVYLATRLAHEDLAATRATLDAWLLGVAATCGYAFLQFAGLDPLPWTQAALLGGRVRPFGTLGHANLLGLLSASAAAISVARAVAEQRRRTLHVLATGWFIAATLVTLSRGAWLALALGLATSAVLAWRVGGGARLPTRAAWALGGAGVAAVAATFLTDWGKLLYSRLLEIVSPASGSSSSRIEIWKAAVAAWQARPLIGHGPDTFALVFGRFQTPAYWRLEWAGLAGHAHSVYLHLLATRGLLGLVAALGLVGALFASARWLWRAGGERRAMAAALTGALAALAVGGAFGAWGIAGAMIATVLAGSLAGLAGSEAAGGSASRKGVASRGAGLPRRAAIAGALAAVSVACFAANEWMASRAISVSQLSLARAARSSGRDAELAWAVAADMAIDGRRRLPWDDHAPRFQAEALMQWAEHWPEERRLVVEAEQAAREAVRRMPLRSSNHHVLGNVLAIAARGGDSEAAREWDAEFTRAAEQSPYNAYVLLDWARARAALGRRAEALVPARRAAALYPENATVRRGLARTLLIAGDTTRSRRADGSESSNPGH